LAPSANVLPMKHRRLSSRAVFIPTVILGVLLLAAAGGMMAYSRYADQQYMAKLHAEIAKLAPQKQRADMLDRETEKERARVRLLDQYRGQTRYDLDTLNELTKLIEPPAWTSSIQLTRDAAILNGEAPQATALIKILDSSPFFKNSNPEQVTAAGAMQQFQIRANRGGRP
jgi:general secretion pathway protein L